MSDTGAGMSEEQFRALNPYPHLNGPVQKMGREVRRLQKEAATRDADAAAMRAAMKQAYDHAAIHSSGVAHKACKALKAALSSDAGVKLLERHAELVEWAKEVIACQHNCDHNEPHELPAWLAPAADGGG